MVGKWLSKYKNSPETPIPRADKTNKENNDPFLPLFRKCAAALNDKLTPGDVGLYEWLTTHKKALLHKINECEEELEAVWQAGLQGEATVKEYREVLKRYYSVMLKAIEAYNKSGL